MYPHELMRVLCLWKSKDIRFPELGLEVVVSYLMLMLGVKLGFPARAGRTLDC